MVLLIYLTTPRPSGEGRISTRKPQGLKVRNSSEGLSLVYIYTSAVSAAASAFAFDAEVLILLIITLAKPCL